MQSDKASKKIRTSASEPVASTNVDVNAANEKTAKPRVSKSSQPKNEPVETTSAKRHRKPASVNLPESATPAEPPKAMAMAAAGNATTAVVIDPVGVQVAPVNSAKPVVSPERIQELAYQYWIAEGRPNGSHHEHWLRAERELGLIS